MASLTLLSVHGVSQVPLDEPPLSVHCSSDLAHRPLCAVRHADAHLSLHVEGELRTVYHAGLPLLVRAADLRPGGELVLISADGGVYECSVHAAATLLRAPSDGTTFERVACGARHAIAVTSDGRAFTWGDGARGQLGLGREVADDALATVRQPAQVHFGRREMVVHVAAGEAHTFACTNVGKLYAWGDGGDGRLGVGDALCRRHVVPVLLPAPTELFGENPTDAWQLPVCGERHSGAMTTCGVVFTWGRGDNGRLGHGAPYARELAPRPLLALKAVPMEALAMGRSHTVAVSIHKAVWVWGGGALGQCGPARRDVLEPTQLKIPGVQIAAALAGGECSLLMCISSREPEPAKPARWKVLNTVSKTPFAGLARRSVAASKRSSAALLDAARREAARQPAATSAADGAAPRPPPAAERRPGPWSSDSEKYRKLWKRALCLLALRRPWLWHAAQRFANAAQPNDRLARIARWHASLITTDDKMTHTRSVLLGQLESMRLQSLRYAYKPRKTLDAEGRRLLSTSSKAPFMSLSAVSSHPSALPAAFAEEPLAAAPSSARASSPPPAATTSPPSVPPHPHSPHHPAAASPPSVPPHSQSPPHPAPASPPSVPPLPHSAPPHPAAASSPSVPPLPQSSPPAGSPATHPPSSSPSLARPAPPRPPPSPPVAPPSHNSSSVSSARTAPAHRQSLGGASARRPASARARTGGAPLPPRRGAGERRRASAWADGAAAAPRRPPPRLVPPSPRRGGGHFYLSTGRETPVPGVQAAGVGGSLAMESSAACSSIAVRGRSAPPWRSYTNDQRQARRPSPPLPPSACAAASNALPALQVTSGLPGNAHGGSGAGECVTSALETTEMASDLLGGRAGVRAGKLCTFQKALFRASDIREIAVSSSCRTPLARKRRWHVHPSPCSPRVLRNVAELRGYAAAWVLYAKGLPTTSS
ncbi:hypothetical protein AB1Y20_016334 [Prymnesium parvum]|uniref:RCC1-like domain-containing protein n=1 Tax=Prymnesium parvum TaxID=97485 RepID=A0AB34IEW0_PRYPA